MTTRPTTVQQRQQTTEQPVMLFNDPHPVHRVMADTIGARLVPAEQGGLRARLVSAATSSYNAPIILEGGVPLVEGAFLKALRRTNSPVILLAADETQRNITNPLPYYSRAERLAHRLAHRFIDGVIAVSKDVAADTREIIDVPTEVANPFILDERYRELGRLEPDLTGTDVLCVGAYRPGNNQEELIDAAAEAETDVTVHLVGKGTKDATAAPNVRRHGFVDEETLLSLFEQSSVFAFPARAGAFPVATLEAMRAGLPVIASDRVGTQSLVSKIHPRFVTQSWGPSVAASLDWYFDQPIDQRRKYGAKAAAIGSVFDPDYGKQQFEAAYRRVVENVGVSP